MNEPISRAFPDGTKLRLQRTYAAPRHRVFQAWIDVNDLVQWYTPDPSSPARVSDVNVSIGGGFVAAFGPAGETPWIERVQYREIDPPHRISMLGHMTRDGVHVAITRYAVDLVDLGDTTELTLTESGGTPEQLEDRASGWSGTLENLARYLG
jgi:uncharacterized protein YndB with AHSA1/START domain